MRGTNHASFLYLPNELRCQSIAICEESSVGNRRERGSSMRQNRIQPGSVNETGRGRLAKVPPGRSTGIEGLLFTEEANVSEMRSEANRRK